MHRAWIALLALCLLLGVSVTAAQEATPAPESLVDALQVSSVLPADGSDGLTTDSLIVVIFNRPVVPLVITAETGDLPMPITIDPPVEGQGEWVNTSIYTFRPQSGLAGGQTYTVTVPAGLTSVDGATFESPFTWSFTTAAPSIAQVNPNDGIIGVRLEETIQIDFSSAVDRAGAEAAFYVRPVGQTSATVAGSFEWADDGSGFRFTPDDNLALATTYAVGFVTGQVTSPGGGAPLTGILETSFSTVDAPGIGTTDPFDGQTDAYPSSGFTIYFQSPMNVDTIEDRIIIDPAPFRDFETYYSDYNYSYTLAFTSEPSTDYIITIQPGIEDIYGNAIQTETVVRYTTRAFDPDVMLQTNGAIGFYNADNPDTRLFMTHRNVSQIDLELYRVPTDAFIELMTSDLYYDPVNNYAPDPNSLLRTWSIASNTDLNQRRYELLNLGAIIQESVACEGTPESRLQIGDSIRVITDAIRVRATPPDGDILEVLYTNNVLPITGGATCAGGYLWWQITLQDGRTGWIAEGDLNEYYIDIETPALETPIDVTDANGSALQPGVYLLRASSPETRDFMSGVPLGHFLIVGNVNLTLKTATDELLIWATDVQTGVSIPDLSLTVYDAVPPVETIPGATDSDGLFVTDLPFTPDLYSPRAVLVDTGDAFGIGLSLWSDGIEGYSFGLNTNYYPQPYRAYLYTDRPIYRPDQPVHFRGVVRLRDDVRYTPLDVQSIPVRISDEMGNIVYENTLALTPYGTFSDTFALAPDAALGYYQLAIVLPGEDVEFFGRTGSVGFRVAEYRAPEFQVTLTPETDQVAQGDAIRAAVDARYFFGGGVQNATVEYTVIGEPYYFTSDDGAYSFVDFDADSGSSAFYSYGGGEIATGTGVIDANGQYVIEILAALEDDAQSQNWRIEATITDESGQAVAGRTSVIVHQGLIYVGVKPEFYVATAQQPTNVDIVAVDWSGDAIAGQAVDITVVDRRWSSVQERDDQGRTVWTTEVEDTPITQGDVITDANGRAQYTFTPPSAGIYKVTTTTQDADGNAITASTLIYVSGDEFVAWRQQNSSRIDLVADQDAYEVGDTAEILIASPFQGAVEALVSIERGAILSYERITLDTNSFVYELPITPDYAPNVYVSVVIVKGVDETNPVAAFRVGMIQIAVDAAQKEITLDIQPSVEQAGPGDTVTFTVTATDYQGTPVQAEIGAGLTDLSVLTLVDPNTTRILPYFYGQQDLSVRTSTPLTINVDQLTQTVLDTIKGGGGGSGEGGIFDIREDFVDTAYWNAALVTDANGVAAFDVTLPDNLTTWRLDLRAVTSGDDGLTLVGDTTYELISTKPLLIRPVTPRFFVVGDQVSLGAIVNNTTDAPLDVVVDVSGTGFILTEESSQVGTISAGGSLRVDWNVTIENVEAVELIFTTQSQDGLYQDASRPALGQGENRVIPVYRYEVPETVGTGGALLEAGAATESIPLPTAPPVVQGDLRVRVEPSLITSALESLEALRNTPYQGVEQVVTQTYVNVVTYRALNGLPAMTDTLRQQFSQEIGIGLQRLYAWQKVDGGWGWFPRDSSDAMTTAYALLALIEARAQGFAVEETVIVNAQNYLTTQFIVPGLGVPQWQLNRQAFVLYALGQAGASDVARTATLYENRSMLAQWAQALLAITVARIDGNTARADVLLGDLLTNAIISANGAHWEEDQRDAYNWNTNTRTTAMVLHALVRLHPENGLIPQVIRWLMNARTADTWETTQETAWSLLALTDWSAVTGDAQPTYAYTILLNATELAVGEAPADPSRPIVDSTIPFSDLLADNTLTIAREDGSGALYYTAYIRAFLPVDQVEALSNGITVQRRYTLADDDTNTPINAAQVGDLIRVRLTVIAPTDLNFVIVDDPIPAGTDAIDPNLNISPQVGTQPEIERDDPLNTGWGWWYFSNIEFRDERVVMYATYLPAGTYEFVYTIRAGLPGTYSVIPPTASEAYFPEVYGRGDGISFTITTAAE